MKNIDNIKLQELINVLNENKNNEEANKMKAYMKNKFEFLGIRSPIRRELSKEFLKEICKDKTLNKNLIKEMWNLDEREYQYIAIDYIIKLKKILGYEDIEFIKELIINKPWWDTIDLIASHLIGEIATKNPQIVNEYIIPWSIDENIWLRRTSLLFQLKYKDKLDKDILALVINNNNEEEDFFIRKGIGWALREYSKVNSNWVREFIDNTKLSKLSISEGSKYL